MKRGREARLLVEPEKAEVVGIIKLTAKKHDPPIYSSYISPLGNREADYWQVQVDIPAGLTMLFCAF